MQWITPKRMPENTPVPIRCAKINIDLVKDLVEYEKYVNMVILCLLGVGFITFGLPRYAPPYIFILLMPEPSP